MSITWNCIDAYSVPAFPSFMPFSGLSTHEYILPLIHEPCLGITI